MKNINQLLINLVLFIVYFVQVKSDVDINNLPMGVTHVINTTSTDSKL